MAIPRPLIRTTEAVEVLGTTVEVRGMTREEATDERILGLSQRIDDGEVACVPDLEVLTLACGLATEGQSIRDEVWLAEVRAWWSTAPAVAVDTICSKVAELSGFTGRSQRGPDSGLAS